MDRIVVVNCEGLNHISIEMDNYVEKGKYFLTLAKDNDLTLQRMYWRSKQDYNHIEYIQPKIFDAFIMVIDVHGTPTNCDNVLQQYKLVMEDLDKLNYMGYEPMTNEEIQNLTHQLIGSILS